MSALRGVNLGGWLVLEKWMTPGLFAGTNAVDEWTFMQLPGAREKLREHQRTFIRETDFRWLRDHGVELVRIPVGYWVLDGDAPYVSCVGRLDWAFRMAEKYNLKVLLDLHGAPGSQNGNDHSGRVGAADWYRVTQFRERTIEVCEQLARRYRDSTAFWGLELLNEPRVLPFQLKLRSFYRRAFRRVSQIVRPGTRIVMNDAFTPRLMSTVTWGLRARPVALDIHWYHFTAVAFKYIPLDWYWRLVGWHGRLIKRLRRGRGIVIGEWSGVIAGEVLAKFPVSEHHEIQRRNIERQLDAYKHADAWCYWTYKTEAPGIWNFRSLVESGDIKSVSARH